MLQYSRIQAFTWRFMLLMQLYSTRRKTAHRALQALFLQFVPLSSRRYQTDTSGYNTVCDTLERAHAPGRPSPIPEPPPRRTLYRPAQPPYYNKVYKRVQHTADHASPAGSRHFPRPAACNLAPVIGQGTPAGTLHPAGHSSDMGAAGGAEPLTATAVSLFGLSPDSQ